MKKFTAKSIARIGRCHTTSASRLMRKGVFGEVQKNGRTLYIQAESVDAIKQIVLQNYKKHGWKKNGHKNIQPDLSTVLGQLVELSRIPQEKRLLCVKLSEKFSVSDMELLLTL